MEMRRLWLGSLIGLLVATVVGGSLASAAAPFAGVTLTVYGDAGHNLLPLEWYAKDIREKSGIDLRVVGVPFAEVYSKLKTEFVAATGAYDVVIFFPQSLGEFAALGYLRPLDDFARKYDPQLSDVATAFRELYLRYGGKLYALPYDGDVLNYYYRLDYFNNPEEQKAFKARYGYDLKPPETWEQAIDIAEFFTRKKGERVAGKVLDHDLYGYAFFGTRGFLYAWWLNHFAPRGGLYFDADMNPMINSPAAVNALEELRRIMKFAPPDVLSYGYDELKDAYLQGRVATVVQWSDIWKKCQDPNQSKVVGKCGISHVPGVMEAGKVVFRAPMPVGRVLAVPTTTRHPEAAYWLAWYLSTQVSLESVSDPRTGLDPYRLSHFNNPQAFAKFAPAQEAQHYLNAVRENLSYGFPDLNIPGTAEYLDKLELAISRALTGAVAPRSALDDAAREWNNITNRLGRSRQKEIYGTMLQTWRELGYLK